MQPTTKIKSVKCFVCNGNGSGYIWSHRDVVEGFKMASPNICLFCDGKKELKSDRHDFQAILAYMETKEKADKERKIKQKEAEEKKKKLEEQLHAMFTKEELSILGVK